MDKNKLINELTILQSDDDNEEAHKKADNLLLEFINDEEITSAFEDVPRWYA